jgi:hypothetical protein
MSCATGGDREARLTINREERHAQTSDLRLPSFGEALSLVDNYDLPPIAAAFFWTEESFTMPRFDGTNDFFAWVVAPGGAAPGFSDQESTSWSTVCVTTPTN